MQCLKLFGKTLLVKDSSGTSLSTTLSCKPDQSVDNRSEGDALFPLKVIPLKYSLVTKLDESNPPFSWLTLSPYPAQKPDEGKHNHDNEEQSSSCSTADSDREKSSDNSNSRLHANAYSFTSRLSKRSYEGCRKGFVPYKRHTQERSREAEKRPSCIC